MVTLIINNSVSQITGLTPKHEKALRKELSYTISPQEAYFSKSFNTTRYLIDSKGVFPTGLLYIVENFNQKNSIILRKIDRRIKPKSFIGAPKLQLGVTPYKEQLDAANAILTHSRGIVVAPTGFGKSFIVALSIDKLKVPTLVVVPTVNLKIQLIETLSKAFGIDYVGDSKAGKYVAVENVDGLDPKKPLKKHYDCVIIDEFHHSAAKTYRLLNKYAWKDIYYRLGLTATPFRSKDTEKLLLESILSKVIYRLTYQEAVLNGYIVPMEAYYIEVPETQTDARTWQQVYSELVVNNDKRNKIITNLLSACNNAGISTLCLVKEIKHGNNLGTYFVNGENEASKAYIDEFNSGGVKVLIGTVGVLGEGVDTRPAEYIIIAGLGKSKPQFMQQCGRGFRRSSGKISCKIILFKDKSHKFTLTHFKHQVKYLKEEYGITPVKLEV